MISHDQGVGYSTAWEGQQLLSYASPLVRFSVDGQLSTYGMDGLCHAAENDLIDNDPTDKDRTGHAMRMACCLHVLNFAAHAPDPLHLFLEMDPCLVSKGQTYSKVLDDITTCAEDAGCAPDRIVLQVKADTCADFEEVLDLCHAIRAAGFKLAFTGFGVGGVNLDRLLDFQPEFVRIHEQMLQLALETSHGLVLLKGMTQLLRDLEITTILCGVDVIEELQHARNAGVCMVAGRFFGQPVLMADLTRGIVLPDQVEPDPAMRWPAVA